jgi:Reeler domain
MQYKSKFIGALLCGAVLFGGSQISHPGGRARMFNDDNTGRPTANGTCGNCHNTGAFGTVTTQILVADASGMSVTNYQPNTTYRVTVNLSSTQTPANSFGGFQCVAVKAANNATQAGDFVANSTNMWVSAAQNRQYAEHKSPSASNVFTFDWVSPSAGFGAVTFYAAGLKVNNTGGTTGDTPSASISLTLSENIVNTETMSQNDVFDLKIKSTLLDNNLSFGVQNATIGNYDLSICDLNGRIVSHKTLFIDQTQGIYTQDINDLPKGNYLIRLAQKERQVTRVFSIK